MASQESDVAQKRQSKEEPVEKAEANPDAQAELATAIDDLLDTVGSKFQAQSKDILKQMDLMAARLDELEAQAKTNMQTDSNRNSASS